MDTITFHCRVITPMFLAGADGQTPELRAPSIKGAMRFWWRAMNGNFASQPDLNKLREKEAKLWGDTSHRSSVLISCLLKNKVIFNDRLSPALKYMAYGAEERKALDVSTTFDIVLSSKSIEDLEEAKKAFSLLTHFGGLGAKSRNGFGAFVCEEADNLSTILNYTCFKLKEQASFTAISEGTQLYRSNIPQKDWKTAITELKKIYADQAKSNVWPKRDRVFIAAPYKDIPMPARHAKLHFMSLTEIESQLYYTIAFLPYDYLAYHEDAERGSWKSTWERVIRIDDEGTNSFNTNLFQSTDEYENTLLVNLLNN